MSVKPSNLRSLASVVALIVALAIPQGAQAQGFDVTQTPWGPGRKSSGELFRSAADAVPEKDAFSLVRGRSGIAVGGQYFGRVESRTNDDFNSAVKDNDTFVEHRARFTLRASIEGAVGVVLEYQDVRIWGVERSTAFAEPQTGVHQAFVDFRPCSWFNLRVGRQEIGYGEDRLVGALDWAMAARAFDGAFVRFAPSKRFTIDLFAMSVKELALLADNATPPNRVRNEGQQFYGIYSRWRPQPGLGLDLYALGLVSDPSTLATGSRGERGFATLGGRVFASAAPLAFIGEGAYQVGSDVQGDLGAYAFAARLFFTLPLFGGPYFAFEYSRASGDGDPSDGKQSAFNQLFPTGHVHLGYMDYVGWSNVQAWRGTFGWRPKPGVHFWIDAHRFEMVEPRGAWIRASGAQLIGADPLRHNGVMGSEVDVNLSWPLHKHLGLAATWAAFVPGDAAKRAPGSLIGRGTDVSHWAFVYLRSQF